MLSYAKFRVVHQIKRKFSNRGYGHKFTSNLMILGINIFLKLSFYIQMQPQINHIQSIIEKQYTKYRWDKSMKEEHQKEIYVDRYYVHWGNFQIWTILWNLLVSARNQIENKVSWRKLNNSIKILPWVELILTKEILKISNFS